MMGLSCVYLILAQLLTATATTASHGLVRKETSSFLTPESTGHQFAGSDVLVALARYETKIPFFEKYVKSARMVGFDGQIILGVHPSRVDDPDMQLLGVTSKPVHTTECQLPYAKATGNYFLRINCSADFPTLKLESARFALARKWVGECKECTGWVLVSDYGDFIFQRKPFEGLGRPTGDELVFEEEYMGKDSQDRINHGGRGIDNTYWFTYGGAETCYGKAEADRMGRTPVLNSGSMFGGREAMLKFLEIYQAEFEANTKRGEKCDPSRISDQATLNYMFYTGAFASLKPRSEKHGEGVVNTIGMMCSPLKGHGTLKAPDHSAEDLISLDAEGFVLNKDGKRANAVHQDKVCWLNLVEKYLVRRYSLDAKSVLQLFSKAASAA